MIAATHHLLLLPQQRNLQNQEAPKTPGQFDRTAVQQLKLAGPIIPLAGALWKIYFSIFSYLITSLYRGHFLYKISAIQSTRVRQDRSGPSDLCFLNEVCHSLLAIFSCLGGGIVHSVLLQIRYKKSVTMNTRVMEGEAFFSQQCRGRSWF